jgi:asparagine synthase (glutamine-hydrolysing)
MTLSYNGIELLSELLRQGRFFRLWRTASKVVARTDMRWRGALVQAFGPLMPAWAWRWLSNTFNDHRWDVLDYTVMPAGRVAELDLRNLAQQRAHDLDLRPWKDSFAIRNAALRAGVQGTFNKGVLAGWGIDRRDPTADKRLVEFCFGVPTEEFIADGIQRALGRRALCDRLPAAVINERKRGYQAADWHESLAAASGEVAAEVDRLADFTPASRTLDVARMQHLVKTMPTSGWERQDVRQRYRVGLLRGISAGHFLRKASGSNQ